MHKADGIEMSGWQRAQLALAVLAVDPEALGGIWIRARSGPVRDVYLRSLRCLPLPLRKIHASVSDAQLFGELDLGATLSGGQVVRSTGILGETAALLLTMAERCPVRLAAHLGGALDRGTHLVVAMDEGADPDEAPPAGLTERLGLFVALDGISLADAGARGFAPETLLAARALLPDVALTGVQQAELVTLAAAFGIGSMRAPMMAMAAARALAALSGRVRVTSDDIQGAAGLIYAHRATMMPEAEEAPPLEAEPPQDRDDPGDGEDKSADQDETLIPAEILLEAVRTALPPDVLSALAQGRKSRDAAGASGSGAVHRGNRRGRPLPSRPGTPDGSSRIDLVATLRAAAPWQTIRRAEAREERVLHIRRADLRLRQFQETSDRLLIFVVDASGSLAMSRLAEAKGAVELLLSEAYARRDHVALIAFRGDGAEMLLPPTRSLVQTKRRLQALPGGGGTPLAAGLRLGLETAIRANAQGMTPTIALLTDGRGNIALDGRADRAAAAEDAAGMARAILAQGIASLVIDTAVRPQAALAKLSAELDAHYIALPRADARRLSAAVTDALDA